MVERQPTAEFQSMLFSFAEDMLSSLTFIKKRRMESLNFVATKTTSLIHSVSNPIYNFPKA